MGCGKSKQAVATDNTVTKSKSSNSIKINDPVVEKATGEENVQEFGNVKQNDSPDALIKKFEYTENYIEETKENTKEKDGADVNSESRVVDKAKNVDEEENFVQNDHSPKNFLSPIRDHEETIESIISDGISGKSEYYSPRAKGHVHGEKTEGNDAVEGEAKAEIKNEEGNKVDVEKESAATGEEKTLDARPDLKFSCMNIMNWKVTPNDLKAN